MSDTKSTFQTLMALNCQAHVEKKGKFSYLSWPWAVQMLRETDATATWDVTRFEGLPYLKTEVGYFVEVAVTVQGVTLSQIHPVLNANNKPIDSPTSFDINTSIQRCLVKAIALHGLGLYVYAGEDLPPGAPADTPEEPPGMAETLRALREEALEGTAALKHAWQAIPEEQRNWLKSELESLKKAAALVDATP